MEIFDALYRSAGAVVIHWAILEQSMEHWAAMIFHSAGGKQTQKRMPRLYRDKMIFLRRSFASLPVLAPFNSEALNILDEIEKLAPIRATIVHGSISAYDPETKMLKFVRLPIDKADNMHVLTEEYLSIPQILDAATKALNLMTRALALGHRLADTLVG